MTSRVSLGRWALSKVPVAAGEGHPRDASFAHRRRDDRRVRCPESGVVRGFGAGGGAGVGVRAGRAGRQPIDGARARWGERAVEGAGAGRRDGRRRGFDRRHGPAAARGDGPAVQRGVGAEHAGHVSAQLQVRARAPTRQRRRDAAGPAGAAQPAAGRRGRGGVRRRRRHRQADVRLREARRGLRVHGGEGPQRVAGHGEHADRGAGAATRLRKGSANSARGAARLVADAVRTARAAGASGLLIVRADSAFYGFEVVAAAQRAGAHFSVTARMTPAVSAAIAAIPDAAWTPIRYPNAVWDDDEQRWISDAEVAEIGFTAFTGRRRAEHVTGRLIVRRVRRLNPATAPAEQPGRQGELFAAYRYHACFTDSPLALLQAEAQHRGHAVIEQVHADLKNGPLAHLPSGSFAV